MKTIFGFLIICAFALACKKEGKESYYLLSKVYTDGLITTEYIYGNDKLTRINYYVIGVGQSSLDRYETYEYNPDGTRKTITFFNKDGIPKKRRMYTISAQGRVLRVDVGTVLFGDDNLANMDYYEEYQYDDKAQLKRVITKMADQTANLRLDFKYDDAGNLLAWETYTPNIGWVLKQIMEIDLGGKPMPQHWKKLLVIPADFDLYKLFSPKQTLISYIGNPAGTVVVSTYLNRKYNDQGYVISETEKMKTSGSIQTWEHTYEYISQ